MQPQVDYKTPFAERRRPSSVAALLGRLLLSLFLAGLVTAAGLSAWSAKVATTLPADWASR